MSTRSNIAIVLKDGKSAKRIYCHWNGYPEHVGRTLLKNYDTDKKVADLIKGGNISTLGPVLGEKHDFNNPPAGMTTYYKRDRGERNQGPRKVTLKSGEGWESILEQEYLYLWKDSAWYYSDHGSKLKKLTAKVCKN